MFVPNLTELNPTKLLPLITTAFPPAAGPLSATTEAITGVAVG